MALVLHEAGHVVVAKRRFYQIVQLRFSLFGAVLYSNCDNAKGQDALSIALAGPLTNFVLALLTLALWWITPITYLYLENFLYANLTLGLVNLLPCFPLDGGRVLLGVFQLLGIEKSNWTKVVAYVTAFGTFGVFCISLWFRPLYSLGLFSFFLTLSAFGEKPQTAFRYCGWINPKQLVSGMEKKTLVFNWQTKVFQVEKRLKGGFLYTIEVVDDHFDRVCTIDFKKLNQLLMDAKATQTLKSLITTDSFPQR